MSGERKSPGTWLSVNCWSHYHASCSTKQCLCACHDRSSTKAEEKRS